MIVGGIVGILVAALEHYAPKRWKPYLPSSMGLGLSWVVVFANSFAFALGAVFAWAWGKYSKRSSELFTVPIASGLIAGEGMMCAIIAIARAGIEIAAKAAH
jgi:uncharacterized oligopeptide transporter (OPT) family protein